MIKAAEKPYIFVGGGAVISGASAELKEFVHKVDAPVCDSLMGKGAFDGTNDLYTGMLGMHGTKTSNLGVSECDLLIAVGVRFSDRVLGNAKKFAKQAKILQFDVDAAEINKNVVVESSIIGDVKEVLKRLNAKLEPMHHDEWIAKIREMKEKFPPMNGEYAPNDDALDDDENLELHMVDYSIGYNVIYAVFSWSVADEAYELMRSLAQKHKVGFFDVSGDDGDIILPDGIMIK